MDMQGFINYCKQGNPISGDNEELHQLLVQCSYDAQRITMQLNTILSLKRRDNGDF